MRFNFLIITSANNQKIMTFQIVNSKIINYINTLKMKKSILIICVFVLSSIGLFAQAPVQTSTQDSIVFVKTLNDYGTIEQGSDGNCEFKFTNNGKSPLVLSNVQASCGCTVPEWPKEPILPGNTSSIKVKYNTNNQGNFNKSITVSSNAINKTVILQIKGNVTPKAL